MALCLGRKTVLFGAEENSTGLFVDHSCCLNLFSDSRRRRESSVPFRVIFWPPQVVRSKVGSRLRPETLSIPALPVSYATYYPCSTERDMKLAFDPVSKHL
jgi:hypothetical protein